jgi:hypothetical protein
MAQWRGIASLLEWSTEDIPIYLSTWVITPHRHYGIFSATSWLNVRRDICCIVLLHPAYIQQENIIKSILKSCITDSAHWALNFCFDGRGWHPRGTKLKSLTGCGQGFCRPPTSQVSWVRRISMKRVRRIGWQTGHHCQRVPALAWRGLSINLRRVLRMERSSDCRCTTTVYRNY